jgi:hypothetical protein
LGWLVLGLLLRRFGRGFLLGCFVGRRRRWLLLRHCGVIRCRYAFFTRVSGWRFKSFSGLAVEHSAATVDYAAIPGSVSTPYIHRS